MRDIVWQQMKYQTPIHDLVTQIREKISRAGICYLKKEDFAFIWVNDGALSDAEKRLWVSDFSHLHHFRFVVDYGLDYVVFR